MRRACAAATASPCGCRAASRRRSPSSPVRATAMSAARRCTATTPSARSRRSSNARVRAPSSPRTAYGADAHRHSIFETAAAIASLKAIYRLDPLGEAAPPLLWPDTGARRSGAGQRRCRYDRLSRLHVRHDRGAERRDAQRQYLARQCPALASDWNLTGQSVIYSLSPLSHNLGFGALVMTLLARRRIRRARRAGRPRARRPHRRDRSDFRDRCSDPCHRPSRRIARPRLAQPRPRERLSYFRRRRAAERRGGPHRTRRRSAKRLWHDRSRIT